jgi:hypothetical protein
MSSRQQGGWQSEMEREIEERRGPQSDRND